MSFVAFFVFVPVIAVLLVIWARSRGWSKKDIITLILLASIIYSGGVSNALVMAINGNKMPVSLTACRMMHASDKMISDLKDGKIRGYCLINEKTKLKFLADIIPFYRGIVSAGDVLLSLGLILSGIFFLKRKEKLLGWIFLLSGIFGPFL